MKYILLIFILPLICSAQTDTSKIVIYNEAFILTKNFMKDPYIKLPQDTIVFNMNSDSVIIAEKILTHDTSKVWIYYKDEAFNDFWETYSRNKWGQGWTGRQEHEITPKKFIDEYFYDKKIELFETVIYSSGIGQRAFNKCGGCYSGTDFLFKIKQTDYAKLCDETGRKLVLLSSNYR